MSSSRIKKSTQPEIINFNKIKKITDAEMLYKIFIKIGYADRCILCEVNGNYYTYASTANFNCVTIYKGKIFLGSEISKDSDRRLITKNIAKIDEKEFLQQDIPNNFPLLLHYKNLFYFCSLEIFTKEYSVAEKFQIQNKTPSTSVAKEQPPEKKYKSAFKTLTLLPHVRPPTQTSSSHCDEMNVIDYKYYKK